MNKKLKILIFPAILLSLLIFSSLAFADEFTGTLTTGISGNNGQTMNGVVIAPPIPSPLPGTYPLTQDNVALKVGLSSAGSMSIRYATDGSVLTCANGNLYNANALIPVSVTTTIEAISCYPNGISSAVAGFTYTINPATPTPTPTTSTGGGGGGGGSYYSFTPTPTPSPGVAIVGDINGNGKVDISDFDMLMNNWGKTGTGIQGDLDHNGVVDILDFNLLMANWSK
jgi:hypothetical protein